MNKKISQGYHDQTKRCKGVCKLIDTLFAIEEQIKTATRAELLRTRNKLYKLETDNLGIELKRIQLLDEIKEKLR